MTTVFELTEPPAPKSSRLRRGGWSWGPVDGAKLRVGSLGGGIWWRITDAGRKALERAE